MYNLLIIDMQEEFGSAKGVLNEVIALIKKAKEDFANITLVEYSNSGQTLPEIREELVSYPLLTKVTKRGDDGGRIVYEHLKESNRLNMPIMVCGVNSDCCVKRTVNTLVECMFKKWNDDYFNLIGKRPDVFIIKKACNHNDHVWMFDSIEWYWTGYDCRIIFVNNEIENALEAVKTKNYF
jgi:nicotinamidase-related amidase